MKILYYSPHPVINADSPSGYSTHIREVIAAFRAAGHEVEELIMGQAISGKAPERITSDWKSVLKTLMPRILWETMKDLALVRFDRRSAKRLNEVIVRFRPDIIYERAYYCCDSGVRAARANNVPLVLEVNAPFPEEKVYMSGRSLLAGRAADVEKRWVRLAKRIVVVSSALKNYLVERGGKADSIIVLPNSVALDKIKVNTDQVLSLREKYGIKEKSVIGFVGSIFPYHGVDVLIRAFSKVEKEFPNTLLMIVGDGYVMPELKSLAQALGCDRKVIFTGNVPHPEVFNYISLFDIATMAKSNWYGSPVKIFEYGALGKAMVVPDTVPVKDVVTDGVDGLIVQSSEAAIAEALRKLLSSAEMRMRMGHNFRDKVLKQYTWETTARRSLEGI